MYIQNIFKIYKIEYLVLYYFDIIIYIFKSICETKSFRAMTDICCSFLNRLKCFQSTCVIALVLF